MTAASALPAYPRETIGKASRRLASVGQIPAVLYGPGHEATSIALDRHSFEIFMAHHAAGSTVVDLSIEGTKKPISAMIREVQHSPVKGQIIHVDFLEVSMNKSVHAVVTLHLVNDPAGVKAGGILTTSLHEVNVEAKPGDLPETIDVDVSGLGMGDALHVGDIVAPKGVTITDDPQAIVASVTVPRGAAEEAEFATSATEEVAAPEVIGEKKADEE